MTDSDGVEQSSRRYEETEATYLEALRADEPRTRLAEAAIAVAEAASALEAAAWPAHFAAQKTGDEQLVRDTDNQAEIAEALAGLWRDIAGAYR